MFELIEPVDFQEIGIEFLVSGWVPTSWMITDLGEQDNRLFTEFIDINAKTFMGGSIDVDSTVVQKRQKFSQVVQFYWMNISFIKKSEGRIVLKLFGQDENNQHIYIPLIVKEFEPQNGAGQEIVKKHGKVGQLIDQYKNDLKEYYKELASVRESRAEKDEIYEDNYLNKYSYASNFNLPIELKNLFEGSEDSHENYLYSDEDKREDELNQKFDAALKWRGPLRKIQVGRINGFELRIYTHDHDKHFHVIHKGKKLMQGFLFRELN
jgi:hypothetical protein